MMPFRIASLLLAAVCLACSPSLPSASLLAAETWDQVVTPEVLDRLAAQIGCTVSNAQQGAVYTYAYDVAAYKRLKRRDTPFGTYQTWDYYPQPNAPVEAKPECTLERPYRNIIEGFQRLGYFHPDEIGQLFLDHNILATDAPGNGLYESLMICKKYGLRHVFFAPTTHVKQPFTRREFEEFSGRYDDEAAYFARWLAKLEQDFYLKFRDDPDQPWIVQVEVDDEPLDVFHKAVRRDFEGVRREFFETFGYEMPLMLEPATPVEKVRRIQFWWWLMDKYSAVARARTTILEKHLGRHLFTGNVHFSTIVDYEAWGEIYDVVGISPRPLLSDDPLAWKYLMGYSTRLLCDLTDQRIMTAPRVNMVAAGARIVPTPNTIKHWYSQVVQNGGDTFFIWVRDFSSLAAGGAYTGPCLGNPDQSTLGEDRWNSVLQMSRLLGDTKIFQPPKGDTAILVPMDTGMLYGWKRVFSAYVELTKAGVWSNFISDQEIWEGKESLDEFKVVYIPVFEFAREPVVDALVEFVQGGGVLVTSDPRVLSHTLSADDLSARREGLFGIRDIRQRAASSQPVSVEWDGVKASVKAYSRGWTFRPSPGAEVVGRYPDGAPAVVRNRLGKGYACFFGPGLMDIYQLGVAEGPAEDTGRYAFFKALERASGSRDLSWIWNVNVDNIQRVTGLYPLDKPQPDESIQFRLFMYPHGDRTILKYYYEE